jgi:hypothetical protein
MSRLLELLAANPDGCTEAVLATHGFPFDLVVEVVRDEFATAERTFAGGKPVESTWVRITDVGRRALADEPKRNDEQ